MHDQQQPNRKRSDKMDKPWDIDGAVTVSQISDILRDIIEADNYMEDDFETMKEIVSRDQDTSPGKCDYCGMDKSHTGGGIYVCARCNNMVKLIELLRCFGSVAADTRVENVDREKVKAQEALEQVLQM